MGSRGVSGPGVAGSRVPRGGKTSEVVPGHDSSQQGTTTSATTPKWKIVGWILPALAIAIFAGAAASGRFNFLNCLDSNVEIHPNMLSVYTTMFCLSPMPGFLLNDRENRAAVIPLGNSSFTFAETGNIEDTDYAQESIYAIFYTLYKTTKLTSQHGIDYQFTFNTWGFLPKTINTKIENEKQSGVAGVLGNLKQKNSPALAHYDFIKRFPELDPERFGKSAYASLITQSAALEYMQRHNVGTGDGTQLERDGTVKPVEIVEIGCGTGAGANLITRKIVRNSRGGLMEEQEIVFIVSRSYYSY